MQYFPLEIRLLAMLVPYGITMMVSSFSSAQPAFRRNPGALGMDSSDIDIVKHTLFRVAAALFSLPPEVFSPSPPMLEPPPRSKLESQNRDMVSDLLRRGWNEAADVFTLTNADEPAAGDHAEDYIDAGPNPSTYGEITPLGARQLFHYMGMNKRDNVVFWDLGMGQGKLVVQAYLELPRTKRVVGVELASSRYHAALNAWNTISQERSISTEGISLRHGDLFQTDLHDATHVYVASLCFTDVMMERLADKLAREASHLSCVATLRMLPGWKHDGVEYVEMTWTKPHGCAVYFYFGNRKDR